jgi:hypothetical protein
MLLMVAGWIDYSFGVGDPPTRQSGVWRLSSDHERSDVHLVMRIGDQLLSVALASSGIWRLERGGQVTEWRRPPEFMPGWTFAVEVVIPDTEVAPPMPFIDEPAEDVHWTPLPDRREDAATAFSVLISAADVPELTDEWPGHEHGSEEVLMRARLGSGETVWIIRGHGDVSDELRSELEQIRREQGAAAIRAAARADPDALFGRTFIPRSGQHGQARLIELALRAFASAQGIRDELDRHEAAFPVPAGEKAMDAGQMAIRLAALLEDLFGGLPGELSGHRWLRAGPPEHLAVQQWRACQVLMGHGGGFVLPDQADVVVQLALLLRDASVLAGITGEDLSALRLGDLAGYGDEAVQRRIFGEITNPAKYEDLMVELYMAAWYRGQGYEVTPSVREGYPDLRVDVNGSFPTFIECKRLHTARPDRVAEIVRKANKQIRTAAADWADEYSGVLVIDATPVAGVVETSGDEVPEALQAVQQAAARALRPGQNRSVRSALVVWSRYDARGPVPGRRMIFALRGGRYVEHAGETRAQESLLPPFAGSTVVVAIDTTPGDAPQEG